MKTKRALALLLSLIMVMTMLPVHAFAADGDYTLQAIEPASTAEDQVTFEIKVTDSFGNQTMEDNGITTTQGLVDDWATFTDGLQTLNIDDSVKNAYASAATPEAKAEAIKSVTDALNANYDLLNVVSNLDSKTTVSPGQYVYVTVKFKLGGKTAETAAKTKQKGIYQGAVSVMYDKNVFEYDETNSPAILNPLEYGANWVKNQSYANLQAIGLEDYRASIQYADQASDPTLADGYSKDISSIGDQLPTSASDKTNITYTDGITNVGAVLLTVQSSGFSGYISKKTEWDVMIPLKVKAGATAGSTSEIGLVPTWKVSGSAAAQLNSILTSTAEASSSNTSTEGTQTAFKYGDEIENSDKVNMTKAQVTVKNKSEQPDADATKYQIVDKANLPYISKTDAEKVASYDSGTDMIDGPNDYIVLPHDGTGDSKTLATTSGWQAGDTVIIYGDKDGKNELGRTKIVEGRNGTVYSQNSKIWGHATTSSLASNPIVRLIPENENVLQPGYGYIKGQQQVWVARLEKDAADATTMHSDLVGPIDVTSSDTQRVYTDNVPVVTDASKLGSKEKPVEVSFGDTADTVLDKLAAAGTTLPSKVDAPYDRSTVVKDVPVAWNKWKDAAQENVKIDGSNQYIYSLHTAADGTTVLKVPFQNVAAGETTPAVSQPTAYYTDEVPVYGSVIYVKVVPNTADYRVANGATTDTLTVSGTTYKNLSAGDQIKLYATNEAATAGTDPIATVTFTPGTSGAASKDFDLTDVATMPAAESNVYLTVTHTSKGITSQPAAITVSDDDTLYVVDNVVIGSKDDYDAAIKIGPKTTVKKLFAQCASQLQFAVQTITNKISVDVAALTEENYNGLTYKKLQAAGVDVTEGDQASTRAVFDAEKAANDLFEIVYTIPDGTTKNDANEDVNYKGHGKTITLYAIVAPRVEVTGGNADNEDTGLSLKVTKNAPYGKDTTSDVIELSGVKYSSDYADNEKIQENDTVTLYEGNTAISNGTVTSMTGDDTTGRKYTINVAQVGRAPDYTKLSLTFAHDEVMNSRKVAFTEAVPVEEYTLNETVETGWADPIKVAVPADSEIDTVGEFFAATEIPKSIDLEYYYLKDDGSGEPDDATKQTKTVTLTAGGWTKPTGGDSSTDLTPFENTGFASTYALNVQNLKTTDDENGIKINSSSNSISLSATFKKVGSKYNGTPSAATIAGNVTVENKPYPQKDTVALTVPTGVANDLTVSLYASETSTTPIKKWTLTSSLTAGDAVASEDGTTELSDGTLNEMGDKLYLTVTDADSAESDRAPIDYTVEPYTVWSVSMSPASSSMYRNGEAATAATDKLGYVKTQVLPTTLDAKVVHLQAAGAGGASYEPKTGLDQQLTLTLPVSAWKNGSADLAEADVFGTTDAPKTGEEILTLTTAIDPDQLTGENKRQVTTSTGAKADVVLQSVPGVSTSGDYALTVSSIQEEDKDKITALPPEAQVEVTVGGTDTADPANDTLKVEVKTGDTDVSYLAGATITLEYPSPDGTETVTGELSDTAPYTYTFETTGSTGFKGFSTSGGTAKVKFTKAGGEISETAIEVPVDEFSPDFTIGSVKPITLNLKAGEITDDNEFAEILPQTVKVVVNDNGTDKTISDFPLVKETLAPGDTSIPDVEWKLYSGTYTAGSTLTEVTASWNESLTTGDFFFAAHLNVDAYNARTEAGTDAGKKLEGKNVKQPTQEVLAIVPVELYTGDNPLKLSEGNNALWQSLKDRPESDNSVSAADKAIATAKLASIGNGAAKEDYRTDLVFYYKAETYTDNVAGYVDEAGNGLASIESITPKGGTAVAKADFENVVTTVKQKVVGTDGKALNKITQTSSGTAVSNIEPHHSDNVNDYFVKADVMKRVTENYKIRYTANDTATDGAQNIYVAYRNVKLRYQPADADLSGNATNTDLPDMINMLTGKQDIFTGYDNSAVLQEMQAELGDFDGSGSAANTDLPTVINILTGKQDPLNMRW